MTLDGNGICHDEPRVAIERLNVKICKFFLRMCERTKTARVSSYFLKHEIERWACRYIRNGELIQAAMDLGLTVEPAGGRNPNADIGISLRSLRSDKTFREMIYGLPSPEAEMSLCSTEWSREAAEAKLTTRGVLRGLYDD